MTLMAMHTSYTGEPVQRRRVYLAVVLVGGLRLAPHTRLPYLGLQQLGHPLACGASRSDHNSTPT